MRTALLVIILLALAAVVIILGMGLGQFGKGGVEGAKRSNKLMQYRIAAQFIAVLLVLGFVLIVGR